VVREDKTTPSFARDDILANAPRQEEGYFRVLPVLE
jgi:Asp-tRNA(Asn)/Glu-tRNA(Gln) amidotransferase C subunit